MDTTLKTYRIPEANLSTLQSRMTQLARRCTRIKVEAPKLTVGAFEDIKYRNEEGFDRVRRVYTVTLESAGRPKINGYEFAAVISPVTDEDGKLIGNVMRRVPGFEGDIPTKFREATNYCDHCKAARYRLETFVIHSDAGFRQIGRNCLANYLGLTDPSTLAAIAEILIDADELAEMSEREGFGGGSVMERIPMDDVLTVAASAIRLYGWLSNKSAQEHGKTSTSGRVREWIFGNAKDRERFEFPLVASDEDKTLAANTYEWLQSLSIHTQDDYRYNLALLAQSVSVSSKNFGIAVSAINAYSKEREFEIRRNARIESDSKSNFIGTIGERITLENTTVLYHTTFESQFGVSHFYKMKSGDNIIVYFASTEMFEQGEVIPQMTARVKNHENRVDKYNPEGVKQTIITRATLPKPPKAPLTPEQKTAKKAAAKLRRIAKTLPHIAEDIRLGKGDNDDYTAWNIVVDLEWQIKRENKL
jgi:hypothetical protein